MNLDGDVTGVLSERTLTADAAPAYVLTVYVNTLGSAPANTDSETADLSPRQQQLNQVALCLLSAACNSLRKQGLIAPNTTITVSNQTYGVDNHVISTKDPKETFWLLDEIIELSGNNFKKAADLFKNNDDMLCIKEFIVRCKIEQTEESLSFCAVDFMSQIQQGVDKIMDNCLQLINQTCNDPHFQAPYRYTNAYLGGSVQIHAVNPTLETLCQQQMR